MAEESPELKKELTEIFKVYPNFPTPKVTFRDIHPLMATPSIRKKYMDYLIERYKDKGIEAICGMEVRGFYFGIPLAFALNVPFVPLRKPGKLPGPVYTEEFVKEYPPPDKLEIQVGVITKGQKVLVLDDLLATGGTAIAAINLLKRCEAQIVEICFAVELKSKNGREKRDEAGHQDVPYHATLQF